MKRDAEVKQVMEQLSAPFDPREIKWKPQAVKGNRCLAIAYIDARLVMDRLDDAVGGENWQDEYHAIGNGSVLCKLSIRFDGTTWVTKCDVGSPSEQPDEGDREKAAVSDALKRAAVKFGIGRYLYRLPHSWVEYDPANKQIAQIPQLPAFAIPPKSRPEAVASRAFAVESLIKTVCAATNTDAAKTVADVLATYKVASFADLRQSDFEQLITRLGSKINELAKRPTQQPTVAGETR